MSAYARVVVATGPHEQGRRAYRRGDQRQTNPHPHAWHDGTYDPKTDPRALWFAGWDVESWRYQ